MEKVNSGVPALMKFTFRQESESVNKYICTFQEVIQRRRRKESDQGREGAERRPVEEVALVLRRDHKKA